MIALGEVAIGIALIIGAFTGLAAIGGATLNFNFMLAGSASTNPVLFLLAVLVLLGWKAAGWIGVEMDGAANDAGGPRISRADSRVAAWVVPTNEELMIARHTKRLIAGQ